MAIVEVRAISIFGFAESVAVLMPRTLPVLHAVHEQRDHPEALRTRDGDVNPTPHRRDVWSSDPLVNRGARPKASLPFLDRRAKSDWAVDVGVEDRRAIPKVGPGPGTVTSGSGPQSVKSSATGRDHARTEVVDAVELERACSFRDGPPPASADARRQCCIGVGRRVRGTRTCPALSIVNHRRRHRRSHPPRPAPRASSWAERRCRARLTSALTHPGARVRASFREQMPQDAQPAGSENTESRADQIRWRSRPQVETITDAMVISRVRRCCTCDRAQPWPRRLPG